MLPIVLLVLAGLGAARGTLILPLWAVLAAAAWRLRLLGSANLWDYLIDPFAWIGALVFLVAVMASRRRRDQI